MQEIMTVEDEWTMLPEEEQVSDDFVLYTDGKFFYAIRNPSGEEKLAFCLTGTSRMLVVSKAVDAISFYIENLREPRVPFVPFEYLTIKPKE